MPHLCCMKSAALLGFLLFSCILSGQELYFRQRPFLFYSVARQSFVVWEGDTVYTAKEGTQEWTRSVVHFPSNFNAEELRKEYFPMNTSNGDYFVISGCGLVWKWKEDSLVRVDHSFPHKNQYGAAPFVYHDTIMMCGGYGFFETKNITTYFDENACGWYLRKTNGAIPPGHFGSIYFQGKDDFYFTGGETRTTAGEFKVPGMWKLNLKTWTWEEFGALNPEINLSSQSYSIFSNTTGAWLNLGDRMLHFDSDEQLVSEYRNDRFFQIHEWVSEGEQVLLSEWRHDKEGFYIKMSPLDEVLGPIKKQYPMFAALSVKKEKTLVIVAILCYVWMWGVLGYYFLFVRRKKGSAETQSISIEQLQWSEMELRLLEQFWKAGADGVEVSEMNHHFNHGNPNFDALKKRRELKLKELRKKLSLQTGINETDIYQEQRLISDRRVKKVVLHSGITGEILGIPPSALEFTR